MQGYLQYDLGGSATIYCNGDKTWSLIIFTTSSNVGEAIVSKKRKQELLEIFKLVQQTSTSCDVMTMLV